MNKIFIKPEDVDVIHDILDIVEDNTEIHCEKGIYKIDRAIDLTDLHKRNIKIIGESSYSTVFEGCGDFRYEGGKGK
jgi:hypothetical protein